MKRNETKLRQREDKKANENKQSELSPRRKQTISNAETKIDLETLTA